MASKKLSLSEALQLLEESSSDEGDFSPSESEYEPSDNESVPESVSDASDVNEIVQSAAGFENEDPPQTAESEKKEPATVGWTVSRGQEFTPRFSFPLECETTVLISLRRGTTELDIFKKLFPRSLLLHIASCTNKRLKILNNEKGTKRTLTDEYEILVVLGICLVMHYNHLPSLADYWSKHPSMGNELIRKSMSRDRFSLLLSHLYFAACDKPADAPKDYYIADVISCFKKTFMKARSESTFQSIDECMAKFKGRSSLKQYLPMKPIKRGIKIWMRCDAKTGYTYDLNLYKGRDPNISLQSSTLGERVVENLVSTIREPNVVLAFDRFFTSVQLMKTLPFPAVGTYMKSRKNTPIFQKKLVRGESEHQISNFGIIASRWIDSKEVLVISNCHNPDNTEVERKMKDGSKKPISCPVAISDYNKIMGGVDLADQKAALYDINRKSRKWWKKVFFKLFMLAVVNSWILHQETHRKKTSLLQFVVPLAEAMIEEGEQNKKLKTRRTGGRPTKRKIDVHNVGDHLPVEGTARKRCVRCSSLKKEKRTKFVCSGCNNALCYNCFTPFHQ